MAQPLRWTEAALADLTEITQYIARDSSHYASDVAQRILDAAQSLRQFAGRGRVVPEYGDPNVRELFIGNYRLIYRVKPDMVYIQAVIHGARDLLRARKQLPDPEHDDD